MHLRVPRSRAVLAELGRPVAGRSIVLAQLWALLWLLPLQAPAAPPRAPRKPATTNYHGVTVTDNYPWLENGDNPAVQKWVQAQNNAARSYLEKLPARAALEYQLGQLFTNAPAEYSAVQVRAGKLFALKRTPPALEAVLVVLTSPTNAASAKVLLGPGLNIDFYEPSRDGRFVAVSLREPASDAGTLHVFESGSGRELPDVVTRAAFPTAGGSVAWGADSAGFYYTRYPHPGERPDAELPFHQQVYFHKLGTAENEDRYEVGREFPRIGRITLKTSGDGRHLLASVANGRGAEHAHWLRDPSGRWNSLARVDDRVERIEFGREPIYVEWPVDDALYLLSRQHAPRGKILRLPLSNPQPRLARAHEVVQEGRTVITGFVPSASGLYIEATDGGPAELRFHDFYAKDDGGLDAAETGTGAAAAGEEPEQSDPTDPSDPPDDEDDEDEPQPGAGANANSNPVAVTNGNADAAGGERWNRNSRRPDTARASRREWKLPLRGMFTVGEMLCLRGDQLLFQTEGFLTPGRWQTYNPAQDRERVHSTALGGPAPVDFADVEVIREFAPSKDGARIPMNIIRRKGTRLDGQNPTLLTGSGGFGISLGPRFEATRRVWLEQGGVIVVANLRGGGEYGEEWHRGGSLTNKQNVFDDFIACAEFLIRSNYTSPGKLAIAGANNGGLLVGAALTQRPNLFRAAVAQVGLFDMLRFERDPNGEFSVPELGSVLNPEQFRALHAYSPYHHVVQGVAYPAVLFLTGEHDDRVNPAHSRKMTARLQEASVSKLPVLLRTGAGEPAGLDERLAQVLDAYAFLFEQLGVECSEVARGPWSGALTPSSALVKAKLARDHLPARLAVSTSPLLIRPAYTPLVRSDPNHYNIVAFPLARLKPDTQYYYALEINGRLDRVKRGQFRTFPAGPASFSFAYASCARTASTSSIFDSIRENHPLFYMNIGDFHYEDIAVNSIARFHSAYDHVLSSPQQAELYRSTPFVYIWDDHDFGGNNANRRARSHNVARAAYDEFVPHYPLASGTNHGPICQTFSVGRVKFILTDLRSERDPVTNRDDAAKSMLGPQQKEWFKTQLLQANGNFPLICWVSSVPWIGTKGSNYYRVGTNVFGYIHHTTLTNTPARPNRIRPGGNRPPGSEEDHWSAYATERREIADFIKSNHIQGVCILHGDSHMLAADDGSNSDYATGGGAPLPVMCAAPLDREPSIKGGPYSQGVYRVNDRKGEGAFGLVTVTDLGHEIQVRYSGRNRWNEEKIALRFAVPAPAVPARN